MPRTNYIFVDFENVQEVELERIRDKPAKVILVLGERHKNLPVSLVKQMLKYAPQVTLIETGHGGNNAADLVLANYIGEAKRSDPAGYFHIVSRDKDFDPLVEHFKDNGTLAARHARFSEIPMLMNENERVHYLLERFTSMNGTRAGKRKALESQIQAMFGKTLSPEEVSGAVEGLIARGALKIGADERVVYAGGRDQKDIRDQRPKAVTLSIASNQ